MALLAVAAQGALVSLGRAADATPVSSIRAVDGFEVELLRSAQEGENSWVSMTFDDRGRILIGLDGTGVARVSLSDDGLVSGFERVENTFKHCRGVLYAHDSLYVSATDSKGLYRLRDTDGDDRFDDVQLLKQFDYRSRYGHGANQMTLGPDGLIYLAVGNDVSFPEGTLATSPYQDPRNDWLVPNPHDAGEDDRVGYVVRFDAEGTRWEVLAGGLRNQVDVAFDADGEMFTYDADMEWDAGLPWYRPNRLLHVVSGGEYGWRWGTGKWPAYYPDSLPEIVDTGLASPTGMEFGTRSNFPDVYRRALFMADWQNGRILMVHLTPSGATYDGRYEVFVEGGPLNVCDFTFGPDGHLYFITGGRGSHSGLYRVRYVGEANALAPPVAEGVTTADAQARQLRRQLESFHSRRAPEAIDFAWPHLSSPDRWIRFAARVAIERQDVHLWRQRALDEHDPTRAIHALMALARVGDPQVQPELLAALDRVALDPRDPEQMIAVLRVYALSFLRQGRPDSAAADRLAKQWSVHFPHPSPSVSRELCEVLVYLRSPDALAKTLDLLEQSATQEDQIHYASLLVRIEDGWDRDAHSRLLDWLVRARAFPGGHLLPTVIDRMRADAVARIRPEDREALAERIAALESPEVAPSEVPPRPLVRQWQMEDLEPELDRIHSGRSYASARQALVVGMCLRCHRIGEEGGRIGPDLTTVANRFDDRALLESILRPSEVIDPKYRHTAYLLDDGRIVQGRPTAVDARQIRVEADPLTGESVAIERVAIEASRPSVLSPMPEGLVDTLTADEILDLIAYLRASGDPDAAMFQRGSQVSRE